jgi:hypothetical protein
METENEDLSKILTERQMKSLAAAKGDPPATCRELLLRENRPDLANSYDSVRKILKLADELAAASRE